ncbi:MAG: transketolase, partial [Methylobacteriaceae bacterium]|nr:transketolase [Methylobacteriaceae bacterium]
MTQSTVAAQSPSDGASSRRMADAIRFLALDAIEAAQSGHPGMPLGMADVVTALFTRVLRFDAGAPDWPDRDRFVLSAGHGSMLLYAALHLLGYADMTLDELRRFRQVGSRTPGHPEWGYAAGVETTTGPLGQGLATALGMALAERMKAAEFGADLANHRIFVIASDGDLMEGVSHEAISLAGHLRLARLIVLFDDNDICIDGRVGLVDSTDQLARFAAAGWTTMRVDGHDQDAVEAALRAAGPDGRPTLIACKTIIGFGSPAKANTAAAHAGHFGAAEVKATRAALGWTHGAFDIPEDIRAAWRAAGVRGAAARRAWEARWAAAPSTLRAEFERRLRGDLPTAASEAIAAVKQTFAIASPTLATRKASEATLAALAPTLPELVSGSADLSSAVFTQVGLAPIGPGDFAGRYIHWGVREHAMAAAMNGIALEGGFIPISGTFLAFIDYCRPAVRLAALMGLRMILVMTHDSIGVGEDGGTHQPVEHLAGLRAQPNLLLLRPADAVESAECWEMALRHARGPSVLALSRQVAPALRRTHVTENLCAAGAYELAAAEGAAQVTLFASGTEVELALRARERLQSLGLPTRVVSAPALSVFLARPAAERRAVIGEAPVKIAVEAAVRFGWDAVIGPEGGFVGMTGYGASGPAADLYAHFGITVEAVVDLARSMVAD